MLKKLSEEKLQEILDCAIHEFADKGFKDASMSGIAAAADISVGVLYKYYPDKNGLFLSCVRYSMHELELFISDMVSKEDKPLNYAKKLVHAAQQLSRKHGDYVRLYHVITCTRDYAVEMANEIESYTSGVYIDFLTKAQQAGAIRSDIDPRMFALFFDNLLMMTQFSYACPYYSERFKIYAGKSGHDTDEFVADQLVKFLESAFTLEQNDIKHN